MTHRYESGVAIFHIAIRSCFSADIVSCPGIDLSNEGFIKFKIKLNVARFTLIKNKKLN